MTLEEKLIVDRLKATFADVDEMEKVFDIVTQTLALREAEIERLKGEIRKLETLWFSENYRMRDLLVRAADALEDLKGPGWKRELIAELRKAAE